MLTSIFKGIRTAITQPKLVLQLWIWNLLIAAAAALPARAWFASVLGTATETDVLRHRFSFGALADLVKYNDSSPWMLLMSSFVASLALTLITNPFVSGGTVEVIIRPAAGERFMTRFFRGGGTYYWRFFRLGLLTATLGAVSAGIVFGVLSAATTPLVRPEWEPSEYVWTVVSLAGAGLVALWFSLALDFARLQVARDDGRSILRTLGSALGFVIRRPLATFGLGLLYIALAGALMLAYVAHEATWTISTRAALIVLVLTQQALMVLRAGFRIMQVGAEWHYMGTAWPATVSVAPAAASVTPADEIAPEAPPQVGDTDPGSAAPDAAPTVTT